MSKIGFLRGFLAAFAVLALSACSSATLAPHGAVVKVVNSIPENELPRYEAVGAFEVKGMQSIEDCYRDLRNQAGNNGAGLLQIGATEADYCDIDFYNKYAEKRCYKMHGVGFRLKSTASNEQSATKSAAQPQI
ncbi:MAG: hypothetical protein ACXWQO_18370 [Bdellovibrionota bacterium]